MKTCPAVSLLFFTFAVSAFAAEKSPASRDEIFSPKEKPIATYDKLRTKSPFEFDPPKPPAVTEDNPFEGISLAGYCGSGDTLTVYLLSGKEKKRITVFGDASPNKKRDDSGFHVVGIERGKSLKNTKVILERNGQKGTVSFDEDTLHSKPPVKKGPVIRDQNGNVINPVPPPANGGTVPPPGSNNHAGPGSQLILPGMTTQPGTQPAGTPPPNGMGSGVAVPAQAVDSFSLKAKATVQPGIQNNTVNNFSNKPGGGSHGRRKVLVPAQ
jgi:hypothetical protein